MADLPFHPMIGNLIAILQLGGTIIFGRLLVKRLFQISGWLWELAVGMVVISQFAYLITFFPDGFWILDLIAWALVFGGILPAGELFYFKQYKHVVELPKSLAGWIALLLSISYLLLALGPPTQADALDYHWGVPIYLMQHHQWPPTEIWLHGSLAGIGEVYILLGMLLHAENLSTLLQALSIIGFSYLITRDQPYYRAEFLRLFVLGCPILLFFVTGPKPQLFPQILTALSLYLTVQHKNIDEKKYLLIVLLLCGAAQQKLSFILTGSCIGLWASFKHIPSNPRALVSASFIVLIFFIPRALWNLQQVSDPTWLTWLTPLPEKFTDGLRSYREQNWWFPFNLLIPSSVGSVSAIIGIQLIIVFSFYSTDNRWREVILLSLIATGLIYFFGQATARSFYEILLWIVVGIALCKHLSILNVKVSNLFLSFQSIIVTVMAVFGILALTPGTFSAKFRERVLIKSAHEFEAIKWMNDLIPPNSKVLSELRSVAFIKHDFLPTDWMKNNINNPKFENYKLNIDYIISKNNNFSDNSFHLFQSNHNFFSATRNPINSGSKYSLYIFKRNQ